MTSTDRARNIASDLAFSGHDDMSIRQALEKEGLQGALDESDFEMTLMMARRSKRKQPKVEFLLTRIIALGVLLWGLKGLMEPGDPIIEFGNRRVPISWVAYPAVGLGLGFLIRPATAIDFVGWFRY